MSNLIDAIDSAVRRNPGIAAKEIAKDCRMTLGDPTIRKSDVNPILYSHTDLWTSSGKTPPKWSPKSARKSTRANPPNKKAKKKAVKRITRNTRADESAQTTPSHTVIQTTKAPPSQRLEITLEGQHYDWQKKALQAWKSNGYRGVVEAVTGAGKSRLGLMAVQVALKVQKKCLIVVPTISLFHQWKRLIEERTGQPMRSLIGANHRTFDPDAEITLGVVNSVINKVDSVFTTNFDLLIADECHRYGAEKWSKSLLSHSHQRLGLTATLERSDDGISEHLTPYFSGDTSKKRTVAFSYDFKKALKDEVVSPFVTLTAGIDLEEDEQEVYESLGRKMAKARERLINEHDFPSDKHFFSQMRKKNNSRAAGIEIGKFNNANTARRKMLSSAEGKMNLIYELTPIIRYSQAAIVYCGDIDSAENINDAISSEPDVTCSAYHSNIPAGDQRDILEAFRTKQIQCLVAVDMLDEGVDIPHADLAIILSSNQQKRQLIQRLGRILRKKENQRGAVLAMCYAKGTSEDPYNHSSHSAVDKVGQLELAREVIPLVPNSICVKRTVTQIQKQIRWG